MDLSDSDEQALTQYCGSWTEHHDPQGWTDLILSGYQLPAGLQPNTVDLLVRLPPQFPDVPPDMFWVAPSVLVTATGNAPPATEVRETHLSREWQRFSRHIAPGNWITGRDDLSSWLTAIHRTLELDGAA